MSTRERIRKAREEAGLTQQQLADAADMSRSAIVQIEKGVIDPRKTTLQKIAQITNKPLEWLLGISSSNNEGLNVIGRVAAGVWKEGTVNFKSYQLPVTPHPGYPAEAQRLWEIEGTSVNRLAREGEYLHGVDISVSGLEPTDGDLVIVRRLEHGTAEYTAKKLVIKDGRTVLRPDSDDPAWQTDLILNGDDSTEVAIIDVVIAKWSPLGRLARG